MADVKKNWVTIKRGEKFHSLSSNPQSWNWDGKCSRAANSCQLCGTPIVWAFHLVNQDDNRQLMVGSECIKWYYMAYMPLNGLERVLEALNNAKAMTRRQHLDQKIEEFRKQYPDMVRFLLSAESKQAEFRQVRTRTGKVRSTAYYRASLRRKGYLRADEMDDLMTALSYWLGHIQGIHAYVQKLHAKIEFDGVKDAETN